MKLTIKKIKSLILEELKLLSEDYHGKFLKYLEKEDKESVQQLHFILQSLPMSELEAKKFDQISKIFAPYTEKAQAQGWEPTDQMEKAHNMLQVLFGEYYSMDEYRKENFIYNKLVNAGFVL